MPAMRLFIGFLAAAMLIGTSAGLAEDETSFAETVDGLDQRDGLFPVYVDDTNGRVLLALSDTGEGHYGRVVYNGRLTSGLGSNPVGLDRGYAGGSEILRFTRSNDRIFVEFENMRFRAMGAGEDERRATEQSFARSIVWSTDILAESEDGQILIDLSEFLTRDPVGAIGRLSASQQGSFSIDSSRSAPITDAALAFPENLEFDALVTLQSSSPGSEVRAVTPDSSAATLTVHHSLIALPDDGYEIRYGDDRAGVISADLYDMAAPLDEPIRRSIAMRHRLERIDPAAEYGPVHEPIVYYVDRGTPPVIRDALIEGASWWADAFDAAGFQDAFRVELLPEGVHPLDARYNVIQWVHRQTRGWSYGGAVRDPRTGEIIRGYVILGSQRVRQDRMIFEGLVGASTTGSGSEGDPLELALARIRQLSAHEVGHTIGLAHNFAASTNDRASVMDYPAPYVTIGSNGAIDTSQAYDTGIGDWDKAAISWLYAEAGTPEVEAERMEAALESAIAAGLRHITDRHARGNNSAHPLANLWDNGADPTASLNETMRVRRQALDNFGQGVLAEGRSTSDFRGVFAPIYLYHRYQVEAAAKAIGGVDFAYENNRGAISGLQPWPADAQRWSLTSLVATLNPEELDVTDNVIALMAPSPDADYDAAVTRELFVSDQYPAFSRRNAAGAAARITLEALLSPARLARLADQHARDSGHMSVSDVFDSVESAIFDAPRNEAERLTVIREAVQIQYVDQMLDLTASDTSMAASRARARLESLADTLPTSRAVRAGSRDHRIWLARTITAGLASIDRGEDRNAQAATIPPGSPIGQPGSACWHCDSADRLGLHR